MPQIVSEQLPTRAEGTTDERYATLISALSFVKRFRAPIEVVVAEEEKGLFHKLHRFQSAKGEQPNSFRVCSGFSHAVFCLQFAADIRVSQGDTAEQHSDGGGG